MPPYTFLAKFPAYTIIKNNCTLHDFKKTIELNTTNSEYETIWLQLHKYVKFWWYSFVLKSLLGFYIVVSRFWP